MTTPALTPVFPLKTPALSYPRPYELYGPLKELGLDVLWEQASQCPCRESSETGEGRLGCPVCGGTGWDYDTGTTTRAIVMTAQLKDVPYEIMGHFGEGLVHVTTAPEQAPGRWDRFSLVNSCIVMQDLVKRTGTVDRLRWPVATRSLYLAVSGTPTTVALSVLRLRKQAADGSAGALLELGVDFAVDSQGRIDWTLGLARGTAPAVGEAYAVRYFAHPRYVVIDRPFVARDTRSPYLVGDRKVQPKQELSLLVRSLARLDWERRT